MLYLKHQASQAQKQFGFQQISKNAKSVREALEQCQSIRSSIDKLANIQEKSLLISLGIPVESDSEDSDDKTSDSDDGIADPESDMSDSQTLPSLLEIVKKSNYNMFEIMESLAVQCGEEVLAETVYEKIGGLDLISQDRQLLTVSYEAFIANEQCEQERNRIADSLNGYIVSESEDEVAPSEIQNASSPIDPRLHRVILKRRATIRRRAK